MTEEFFLQALGNNGIAAAALMYVLFRITPTLRDLSNAINKLNADATLGFKELTQRIDHRLDALEKENHDMRIEIDILKRREK